MITITHFSSLDLKKALQFLAEHTTPQPAAAQTATPEVAIASQSENPGEEKTSAVEMAAEESTAAPEERLVSPEDAASQKEEVAAAQAAASAAKVVLLVEHMGAKESRAARLVDALSLVENQIDRVSKVTVVQQEGAPSKAIALGDFAYVVDRLPSVGGRGGKDKGRGSKPGGRGGKPKGPRRPGEGGKKSAVEDLRAPFSMDVAIAERKDAERARKKSGGPGGRGGKRSGRGGPGGRPSKNKT